MQKIFGVNKTKLVLPTTRNVNDLNVKWNSVITKSNSDESTDE